MKRTLVLKKETLAELTGAELASVVGAGAGSVPFTIRPICTVPPGATLLC
jgi:hypothetical protein